MSLIERIEAKILEQRQERGTWLDYGEPDAELVDAKAELEAMQAEIDRLRGALGLAAGRLYWTANANPGVVSPEGKALVLRWEDEARASLDRQGK